MEIFHSITITFFTVVLGIATIALALYTKGLVAATRELVRFQEREKRRADIKKGLELIEQIRSIDEVWFADRLNIPGIIPEPISTQLRQLNLLGQYIKDSETKLYLRQLVQIIDNVQLGSSIGDNSPAIDRLFQNIKERMGWSITEWRDELNS